MTTHTYDPMTLVTDGAGSFSYRPPAPDRMAPSVAILTYLLALDPSRLYRTDVVIVRGLLSSEAVQIAAAVDMAERGTIGAPQLVSRIARAIGYPARTPYMSELVWRATELVRHAKAGTLPAFLAEEPFAPQGYLEAIEQRTPEPGLYRVEGQRYLVLEAGKNGGGYYGMNILRECSDGSWETAADAPVFRSDHLQPLRDELAAYGAARGRCRLCGRDLDTEESLSRGYGPDCAPRAEAAIAEGERRRAKLAAITEAD